MKNRGLGRAAARGAAILGCVLLALLAIVKLVYGGGRPYPNVATAPLVPDERVAVIAELDLPPGNVTRSRSGRVFFNTHPFARADRFASAFLFEIVDGVPRPYPDLATQKDLAFVFGLTADAQDRLWVTSPATLDRERTRIQAFDLASGARVVDRELAPGVGRFAQDLRVSPDGRTLYLADTGAFRFTRASILVIDLADFSVREVLAGHPSTQPQDWVIRTRNGPYRIGLGLLTFTVGVDGIALSPDGAWLYYATMSHDTLYRIRTEHLRNQQLSDAELGNRVEVVGKKPLSDGIELAPDGRVLVTDVENGGIALLDAAGKLATAVRLEGGSGRRAPEGDPEPRTSHRVIWADGVTASAGGEVLFTDSAIPTYIDPFLRPPPKARLDAGRPYRIYRFRLP